MTTITIDRTLLEQALASMVRAELVYGQPNQAIQEAIRAELAKPPTAPAWHDAPTCDGLWCCVDKDGYRVFLELDSSGLKWLAEDGERWYGPIPQEGDKP